MTPASNPETQMWPLMCTKPPLSPDPACTNSREEPRVIAHSPAPSVRRRQRGIRATQAARCTKSEAIVQHVHKLT